MGAYSDLFRECPAMLSTACSLSRFSPARDDFDFTRLVRSEDAKKAWDRQRVALYRQALGAMGHASQVFFQRLPASKRYALLMSNWHILVTNSPHARLFEAIAAGGEIFSLTKQINNAILFAYSVTGNFPK